MKKVSYLKAGSCAWIILLLVVFVIGATAILAIGIYRHMTEPKEKDEAKVEKSAEEQYRDSINEALGDLAPELGFDDERRIVKTSISDMKASLDKLRERKNNFSAEKVRALREYNQAKRELTGYERKLEKLDKEVALYPDDENLLIEHGRCIENIEKQRLYIVETFVAYKGAEDRAFIADNVYSTLTGEIRSAELQGRTVISVQDMKEMRRTVEKMWGDSSTVQSVLDSTSGAQMDDSAEAGGERQKYIDKSRNRQVK